jgi:hypothetical protein
MRAFASIGRLASLVFVAACAQVNSGHGSAAGGGGTGTPASGTGGSGPVSTGSAGFGGFGGPSTNNPPPNCGKADFDLERKPASLMLVLDRSGSMDNKPDGQTLTKWQLTTASVDQIANQTNADISWGLKTFPEGTANCAVTPTIPVQIAPMNYTAVSGAIAADTPDGDGTPTGDAIKAATQYLMGVNTGGAKYMLLATDGDPTCSGSPSPIGYAVAQLQAAVQMGIHTFVIGIGTGSDSDANLAAMADAGGEARHVVNPLDKKFYPANSQQELLSALGTITGNVIGCVFPLATKPPLINGVHVVVNGTEIYIDPAHQSGWDYTDTTYSNLKIYGPLCDQIMSGGVTQVHIQYDCMPVIPT